VGTGLTHAEFGAFVPVEIDAASDTAMTISTQRILAKDVVESFLERRVDAFFAAAGQGGSAIRLTDASDTAGLGRSVVRSYLAVPVKAAGGDLRGGLFFGSAAPAVFTEQHERIA